MLNMISIMYLIFLETAYFVSVVEGLVDDLVGGDAELAGDTRDAGIVPAAVAEVGPFARGHESLLLARVHFRSNFAPRLKLVKSGWDWWKLALEL